MSQYWRSESVVETAMGKFLRHRWQPNSIYVLDVDHLICDPGGYHGLLIEEKHSSSKDRKARITRTLAAGQRWWAALFVYDTDDGTPTGNVTAIEATFWPPVGKPLFHSSLDFEWFDRWVCEEFGAKPRSEAA